MTIDTIPREDESLHTIDAVGARLTVTRTHLIVTLPESQHRLLDMPIAALRRIQYDIERKRPATLVIVPEHMEHEAQVLGIPPESYAAAARALEFVGGELHTLGDGH